MASRNRKTFHLFNCHDLCNLSEVESLLRAVEKKAAVNVSKIVKHPFRGGQITDAVEKTIPSLRADVDYAVFVVDASECFLTFNEDSRYGKLYVALKRQAGLDGNLLLVIDGDENYQDEDEKEKHFVSDWARKNICRQFRAEDVDGRRSFIFSWDKKHRPVHEEALLHYFDPSKKGQKFVYKPKSKPLPESDEVNFDPPATLNIQQEEPESSLQEPVSEEETMDSLVDWPDPSESGIQVSSEDAHFELQGNEDAYLELLGSTTSIKLMTYLRYGKISYASRDVLTWDSTWRPPSSLEEMLKEKWKSYRLKKLTIFVDETGKVKRCDVASPSLWDYLTFVPGPSKSKAAVARTPVIPKKKKPITVDAKDTGTPTSSPGLSSPNTQHDNEMDTGAATVVPPEIIARGPLAFEAYSKALAEGRTCDKRVPIMLIGQDRSGKTSLRNSLMGKPFNSDEDSTVGIAVDPSHFKVSTEVWKAGVKNQEKTSETSISYEHQAARLTVQNLRKKESMSKEGDPEVTQDFSTDESSDDSTERDVNDSTMASPTLVAANCATPDDHELSDITKDFRSGEISHFDIPSNANSSQDSITGMPENIASLIEGLLREGDEVDDKEVLYSVLWDFGGQAVYYATHPLFLTPRAIYLLVNDLSCDPRGRAKSVMRQGMFTKFEDSFDFRSNFDYLEFWMSSVAALTIEDKSDHQVPKSKLLPKKLPPVFFVCTHADIPYGGVDSITLANEVFGSLQTKPYETHLYHHVFVVDNTKSGNESECPEVRRLRKEVLDVAKELPQMKEAIPIKWLRYEKELQVMKEDGHKYIPLERAKQVASEVCNIADDEQFLTLLNFLHDQRILIHFADTPELNRLVILDPQWLIDVFKEVITIRPYQGKEKEFKELWFKLEQDGIMEEKLLEHVWGPLFNSKETPESLIAIMEKFSLLCPLPTSDESCGKQYLVPSMLMSHPPEDIAELIKSAQIPSLFLKFESGHVLRGLFPRLVLQFFQWAIDERMIPVNPQFYHNFARFYICEDENCSVVLLCHSFSIEVVVHKGNFSHGQFSGIPQSKLSLSADAKCDTCARAVRRQLGLILESMRNAFSWLKNLKYEVSFICPVCCEGNSVNYCRTHRAKRCEQEECLHFWSESQLYDVKTLSCSKSAVAKSRTFQTEQFAPWLLPQRNQLIAAEHGGRNLDEAKEIALPDEVQKSLLTQTCDAKEIVLQLQMKQASLEQPDCETKALIRCLAKKSKDSDRRDVFQHLREITPAGTTGPFLPEHLDVRNIPGSNRREVTINLCGGDEWKVVAEALGLTQAEIRFLDNRTLNPLDAALAFIAKQRCITVGDLYDVLAECGCPVTADLL